MSGAACPPLRFSLLSGGLTAAEDVAAVSGSSKLPPALHTAAAAEKTVS